MLKHNIIARPFPTLCNASFARVNDICGTSSSFLPRRSTQRVSGPLPLLARSLLRSTQRASASAPLRRLDSAVPSDVSTAAAAKGNTLLSKPDSHSCYEVSMMKKNGLVSRACFEVKIMNDCFGYSYIGTVQGRTLA